MVFESDSLSLANDTPTNRNRVFKYSIKLKCFLIFVNDLFVKKGGEYGSS